MIQHNNYNYVDIQLKYRNPTDIPRPHDVSTPHVRNRVVLMVVKHNNNYYDNIQLKQRRSPTDIQISYHVSHAS